MKRILSYLILTVCSITLAACTGFIADPQHETSQPDTEKKPGGAYYSLEVELWNLFSGELPTAPASLPVITQVESMHWFDAEYMEQVLPSRLPYLPSGWRVALDQLLPQGISAESGEIIYASSASRPPVICLYHSTSNTIRCLLRKDIAEIGIQDLDIGCFELYIDGQAPERREDALRIWSLHTSGDTHEKGFLVLDGDRESHHLVLVHKKCPALQYEIWFEVEPSSGFLYIYNIMTNEFIRVPVDKIP